MKLVKRIALVLLFLSLFIPARSAHADIAPPPAPGFGGIKVFQPTEVEMIYERVEVDINTYPKDGDSTPHEADITAWFVMRNTGKADEQMQVVFPLSNMRNCDESGSTPRSRVEFYTLEDSFSVEVSGQMVITQKITSFCSAIDEIAWGAFDVNFPVGKDVLIKVNYKMQASTNEYDKSLALEYVLATGSGWKGPIKQAYVVFRFPYLVTDGNIDAAETTLGYQKLYNEIFWSFRDMEPTPKDNVVVSFFEPGLWQKIRNLESAVSKNPKDVEAWLKLLEIYHDISPFNLGQENEENKYQQAIAANPDNAELYSGYANFLLPRCCYYYYDNKKYPVGGKEYAENHILPLISKSLALDAENQTAKTSLNYIRDFFPDLAFTPPPTLPPTVTPLPSITPRPSQTPESVEVTVVQTQIVSTTPEISTATSTTLPVTTLTPAASSKNNGTNGENWILWPALLVVGFTGGVFISKKKWI
jgi:hypothetical protein